MLTKRCFGSPSQNLAEIFSFWCSLVHFNGDITYEHILTFINYLSHNRFWWSSKHGSSFHNMNITVCKFRSKVKIKLSLCFNWAPRHGGVLGEWRYSSTHSSTSALDGGEWSASRPGRYTTSERDPGTHWIGWVGPRAVLDAVVKRKIPSL
jgi:hypothetical protein